MTMTRLADRVGISPLERFMRDYVDARQGAWDEIEPQVYDLMLDSEMLQVAFDPEALPEHPEAKLVSFGSPMLDRLLGDAARRWNFSRVYRLGLNLHPHDLAGRLRRAVGIGKGAALGIERSRAMSFPQAVFWFQAQFTSDQKEQEMVTVAMDLHSGREVRQIDSLLAEQWLGSEPDCPLPEAPHQLLAEAHRAAQDHAARTVGALANARRREWSGQIDKQIARMTRYYTQLRQEIAEPSQRGRGDPADAGARAAQRLEAVDREEHLRIAELRQKSALRVWLRLTNLLLVQQPKLLLRCRLTVPRFGPAYVETVWDPLAEAIEPIFCPRCRQPGFSLDIDRGGVFCGKCQRVLR